MIYCSQTLCLTIPNQSLREKTKESKYYNYYYHCSFNLHVSHKAYLLFQGIFIICDLFAEENSRIKFTRLEVSVLFHYFLTSRQNS